MSNSELDKLKSGASMVSAVAAIAIAANLGDKRDWEQIRTTAIVVGVALTILMAVS